MNNALDPVLRPLDRLRICAALKAAGATEGGDAADREMSSATLRDVIDVSDAALSEQLGVLESHGYVARDRIYGFSRAKNTVWVRLTAVGDAALAGHLTALRHIANRAEN